MNPDNFRPLPTPQRRHRNPIIRWATTGATPKTRRYNAHLTSAAYGLVLAIAKERKIGGRIGLLLMNGQDEDAGTFALRVVPWGGRGQNPFVVAVSPVTSGYSRGAQFAAGALIRLQPAGYSLLERHGDYLVGRFGSAPERPRSERQKAAIEKSRIRSRMIQDLRRLEKEEADRDGQD